MQKNCHIAIACTCHPSTFHKNQNVKSRQFPRFTHDSHHPQRKMYYFCESKAFTETRNHLLHSYLNHCKVAFLHWNITEFFISGTLRQRQVFYVYIVSALNLIFRGYLNYYKWSSSKSKKKKIINKQNYLEQTYFILIASSLRWQ